jgi:thymidylate kinase
MADASPEITTSALEGLPFAGKSSCGRFVAGRHPKTLLLADYHDLLPAGGELAQVPGSAPEQRGRIEMYLELDRRRWKQALDAAASSVVLDRCHVSLMAYAIALEPWIGATASRQSIERIERALADPAHPLRAPTRILYLEMSAQTASNRCRAHATTMQERMRTVEFAKGLIEAYEHVLAAVESEVVRCSSEQPLAALEVEVEAALRVGLP